MKKITFLAVVAVIFYTIANSLQVLAAPNLYHRQPNFPVRSQAVYMENLDTGLTVYEKNSDQKMYPASLTKIMTALVVLEHMEQKGLDLDNEKVPLKLYIQDLIYGTGSSLGGILRGEEVSVRGLLYATLLQSAGEAALMLADYVGDGAITQFIEMMNKKAADLGCTNTNFANPHGLHDPENYTTARDMALICKHAMKNPIFAEIVATPSKEIGPTNRHNSLLQINTNKMLFQNSEYYYAPAQGIKTGTLTEAGRCLAAQATAGGYTYLLILLGTPMIEENGTATSPAYLSFYEARRFFEWAFNTFGVRTLVERGEEVEEVKVRNSFTQDHVTLATKNAYTTLIPKEVELSSIQFAYEGPRVISAPVEHGQKVGTLRLLLADEEIGTVTLVATDSVEASHLLLAIGWFGNVIHTFHMKFIVILLPMLILLYTILMLHANRRQKRKGRYSNYRNSGHRERYL